MKGQSSLEFISVITMALVLSSPLIALSQTTGLNFISDVTDLQFDNSLEEIADTVDRAETLGSTYARTEIMNVPDQVVSANKITGESFQYFSRDGVQSFDVVTRGEFNILRLPTDSRQHEMRIINEEGRPWILPDEDRNHLTHLKRYGNQSFNSDDVPVNGEIEDLPNQIGDNSIELDDPEFVFSATDNKKGLTFESRPLKEISTSDEMAFYTVHTLTGETEQIDLLELNGVFEIGISDNEVEVSIGGDNQGDVSIDGDFIVSKANITEDDVSISFSLTDETFESGNVNVGTQADLSLNDVSESVLMTEFIFTRNSSTSQTSEYLDRKYGG